MSKPAPHLDEQSTKLHNLSVLQRMDPAVEDVLATAVHVVLYEFDVEEMSWSRKDVEGSLFVVKRRDHPRFQFIVMNRKSAKNLVEDLLGEFEFEVQEPYLLYRNATQEVNGIWFYHTHERDAISALFTRILTAFHKQHPTPSFSTSQSELGPVPGLEPSAPPASQGLIEQHLEAALQISSSPSAPPYPHPLLTDLFAHSSALPSSSPPLVPTDLTQLSSASMTTFTHHYEPPPPSCTLDKQVFKAALTQLVQDEAFIDMVFEAVMKAHSS